MKCVFFLFPSSALSYVLPLACLVIFCEKWRFNGTIYFYSNHNLIIADSAKVTFGSHVFIAPNCCFTTAEHPVDSGQRKAELEIVRPINIGNNVWIGAGTTVLAGVNIGDNSNIGAGSVVSRSIPANVVAVGVPCRVMREITEADKYCYPLCQGN